MKKLLSLALAMALCLSLTVPALAANPLTLTEDNVSNGEFQIVMSDVISEEEVQASWGKPVHVYRLASDATVTVKWVPEAGKEQYDFAEVMLGAMTLPGAHDGKTSVVKMEDGNFSYTFNRADMVKLYPDVKYVDVSLRYADELIGYKSYFVTFDDGASTDTPAKPAFTDVADNSPFKDAIAWAVEKGITNGTTPTTFGPSNTCTHNHILTFLWRASGSPAAEGEGDFAKAAAWAKAKGLLSGDAFDGGAACTRSQTMMYLWKLAGSPKTAVNSAFTDVAADAGYAQAVAWAVANGITNGVSASAFGPDNTCTRGQIVTFLYRNLSK